MRGVFFSDAKEAIRKLYPGLNFCACECHVYGMDVAHIMPCCALTYEKYIYTNGTLDMAALLDAAKRYAEKETNE